MPSTIKVVSTFLLLSLIGFLLLLAGADTASYAKQDTPEAEQPEVIVSEPVTPHISPAVRDLSPSEGLPFLNREINPRKNPLLFEPDQGKRGSDTKELDPLVQQEPNGGQTPDPILNFDGMSSTGSVPPDTVGDVGPNHYVQMVNVQFAIYDKNGNQLQAPTDINQLWQGQGGNCESNNDGDPIVLYDRLAGRWLLSQFSQPAHMCVAISQTADPTGSYYLYEFNVGDFPDYFKFGVWTDGYYMSANENTYTAYAFDRANMLAGQAATFQKVTGQTNLLLPSDLDGATAPPNGAPNYFYTFKDNSFHGGSDRIEVFAFDVDWDNTNNTSFSLLATIPITSFNYTVCEFFILSCIPQPSPGEPVDPVSEWPMWRFQYRNFDSHETLVGNFTVDTNGNDHAGIRWFELRKSGGDNWTLYQEGTHAPDSHDRWMGSIAMDQDGNIGMGYSISSSSLNPAIRYVTRLASDALGTLQSEATLMNGGGVQTDGFHRWGDYSSLNVDPFDDCTFWYTTEYYLSTSPASWRTRVGTFKIPSCGEGGTSTPSPTATNTSPPNTATPSNTPTNIATHTPGPSPTPSNTPTNIATHTPGPSPTPSNTPANTTTPTVSNTPSATATPVATVIATVEPDTGGILTSDDGNVLLDFPSGAVDTSITIIYSPQDKPSQDAGLFNFAGTSFTIDAFDDENGEVDQFNANFTMTVLYDDEDWVNAAIPSEDALSLFYWDGSQWVDLMPCDGCSHDTTNNTLTIMLNHLTEFALLGDNGMSNQLYLPLISR